MSEEQTIRAHLTIILSQMDEEKDKEKQNEEEEDVDRLIDEEFLRQYISKRMEEMMATTSTK